MKEGLNTENTDESPTGSSERCIKNRDASFRFIALALCICSNFGWYG